MTQGRTLIVTLMVAGLAAGLIAAAGKPATDGMPVPKFDGDGALLLPKDFDDWIFVSASMGLSYSENDRHEGPGVFHNVYMQPEAYRYYKATGDFPEQTMFVMTNYAPSQKSEIIRSGYFEGKQVGLEVALKDQDRFEDGWAYYNFSSPEGLRETAKPFPRFACWDCHAEHGEDDNVFVQYYPTLRRLKR